MLVILAIILCTPSSVLSEEVITPLVSVHDETPSEYTGRVIYYPNKTVEIRGLEGEKVVMECNVFNMPRGARIFWRRENFGGEQVPEVINDGLMSRDISRWKVGQGKQQDSVRLEILSLDKTYEGLYTCECQYTGSVLPARIMRVLYVFAPPTIVYHLSSYNTDAEAGDPVTLRCAADGIPTPLIYWQRTGGASSIIRNYGATKSGNEIVFDAVTAEDAGEYICFAENSMGRALWRVQLTVRHLPIVRIYPFQPRQKLGCKLRLVCLITANPAVTETGCIWSSNKTGTITSATPGTKIQYLNAGTTRQLVLDRDQIQSTDFWQKFTCTATNTLGTASTSVVLTESATEVLLVNGRHACDSTPQRMTSWATCISMVLLLKLTVL